MQWLTDWQQSDEGKAWQGQLQEELNKVSNNQTEHRNYNVPVTSDGSFEAFGVEPGNYTLHVRLLGKDKNGNADYGNLIGTVQHDFEVPNNISLNEPIELGDIQIDRSKKLTTGDSLPELQIAAIDGSVIDMGDFAGKYVLLNFWYIGLPTPTDNIQIIKEIYHRFSEDSRFEILGLTFKAGYPRMFDGLLLKYIKENGIQWPLGVVNYDQNMYEVFGMREFPYNVLVGPDGKVIAVGVENDELQATIEKALSQ